MGVPTIEALGRYPLSTILSFLGENEGASFLITRKKWAASTLPLFRLPDPLAGMKVTNAVQQPQKFRHKFVVYAAQDSDVLLARLNTRRLGKRLLRRKRDPQADSQGQEFPVYQCNLSTVEIANIEWLSFVHRHALSNSGVLLASPILSPPHPSEQLLRFLSAKEASARRYPIVLASYPRSGNTLLRSLLERVTGVVTGSDNRPDRSLSRSLALDHDLVGEGVVRPFAQIVKTHWPERRGFPFWTRRAILLVRNPWDAIDSYWNLVTTNTHTERVTDAVYEQYQHTFKALALNEMRVWLAFNEFWLAKQETIPLLLVRFEDLVQNMESELQRILEFMHIEDDPASPFSSIDFLQGRVRLACSELKGLGYKKKGSRSLRVQPGIINPKTNKRSRIGKSIYHERYSSEVINSIMETIVNPHVCEMGGRDLIDECGYKIPEFPSNFENGTVPRVVQYDINVKETMLPNSKARLKVNDSTVSVRKSNDPFGRAMREWRLAHTEQDKKPFPTVRNA